MTLFGPQLIGETEKSLNAILRAVLAGSGLTEPHWVTLRIASQQESGAAIASIVAERAHFTDAPMLVADLRARGLLDGDGLSESGAEVLSRLGAQIKERTAQIWTDLPAEDVTAAERVLNLVAGRARDVLSA